MRIVPFLFGLALVPLIHCISFDLPPGKEECFYEDVHQGTSINGAYAVTQGSNRDIDVYVFNPHDRQVYSARKEGEDKFLIKADMDGTYKLCFSNTVRFFISLPRSSKKFVTDKV